MEEGIGTALIELRDDLEEDVLKTAIEALDWAKENAPWQDITGDARNGLDTEVEWDGDAIVWTLYHTVTYGIWLETIQNGMWAIIMPTLEQFGPQIGDGGGSGG
jgi:hypothetical protein